METNPERSGACCQWLNRAALRYWTFHVCVSAAPSFLFAYGLSRKPERLWGMVLGVAFFIALYTLFSHWTYPSEKSSALWRRAMRLATWIRTVWAILALPGLMLGNKALKVMFSVDLIAGMIATSLTYFIGKFPPVGWVRIMIAGPDANQRRHHVLVGDMDSLLPTFLTTVIEGFILSGLLFCIAFVCLWAFAFRARRAAKSSGLPASVLGT
ncbi:MAG: hypothetical protein FD161_407 [Limisphaerales bacterium]|nr:MAG: hypothetical protein FD161_407 [Limisphaerales bacterium]KAG0510312.1 MAG: hypothetical protein E1N63_407 [Limisphaerales bacterium]TXT51499.1 MAG: hypothetical protein FD140_1537 [Limisphaerales bacterium]